RPPTSSSSARARRACRRWVGQRSSLAGIPLDWTALAANLPAATQRSVWYPCRSLGSPNRTAELDEGVALRGDFELWPNQFAERDGRTVDSRRQQQLRLGDLDLIHAA